ncbi:MULTISPECIES: MerR family transcriptional regulator [Nocardia]|uniref:MerR family transcriptional regulator n=1 Tax=Nocardia TaxID=1817 RepID=UPI000BEF2087|nr:MULTISPECIES: MerR family transcriptional regulator [Nocardia]MBF6185235.1 MerR family transcriptional regulator [Nocardia farcinica]MBF6311071.1 MerR family transcriptional regulator [Nocardia farcinica]MBF6407690.1 MerR family transcriptional regulator [Nocardia farcinica]PEH77124.1 MerR family transcriptional regulator [Nocardia sp. FDAARGOS_372]UEX21628.1 MerR family transcriptional regulator [Nocardia farcinica]
MLTIGELAAHAGVTVRAVRHYHAKGLLAEPERDHSGYRRYPAAAVVELIRIRTLAEAGVPLARVRELLRADPTEFAAAVAEIDDTLRAEIRRREGLRRRIAHLAAGDRLVLPPELIELLDRLRALGVDERIVQAERDGWIPLVAREPERAARWIAHKRARIADPGLVQVYRALSGALDQAGDHDLAELADTMAAYLTGAADDPGENNLPTIEAPLVALVEALAFDTWPPARRLLTLLRERGWSGWTEPQRVEPSRGADRATDEFARRIRSERL